ncbi:MAG: Ig-like domain repeat protein [Chloroflexi bacterium]|nr:Ig-like domain repeat protein [Chloroflexota bacterium]
MKHQFFSRFLSVILIVMLAIVALPVTPARAAIFTVTKTSDTNDGTCDADCSLREAIIAANGAAGADTITLPAGTYTLTRVGTDDNSNNGDLDITDGVGATDITLTGAGSGSTTINGAVGWADRIFDVRASATVSMSGVTISGGNINNANGAGILKNGNGSLTLTDVVLSGNAVTGNPARGGGLYSNDGTVTITNSTISSNSAAREGGGIYANNGILNITLGTLGSNTAGREGGAINTNAVTTISNTTITGNSVTSVNRDGGGLWANANTTVINSTFSGNTTTRNGGNVFRNGGTVSFRNTILNAGSPGNCSGAITNTGTNIDSGSTCFTATNGSLINTDPSLGTLTGSPAYFPLNTGSPAIDAGDNTACAAAPVSNASQNGLTRPLDGNGDSTLTCDIGSYEAPTALLATTTLITADTPDPSLVGETVAVTVTVSGGATPTGTVDITGADTNCSITLAGGTGSCNVTFTSVGPKTLTATYNPDAAHSASSDTEPHTVNQATSTVTVTCPAAPQPYTGAAQTPCTASYSTSDGLNGSLTPTYSNNTNVGTATANATYAGDANHAGNSNSGTFDISQATSSVTVTCPASVIYTGAAQTPCTASYSTSDGLSGSLTPTYSNNTNVGTATANATYAGDANQTVR